ncbi:hypothetical protein RI844_00470 [Thalassotalea fonticola]|uniref:Uncharacterized protein n=1 Tax=Thalassotalea fonticola TaxID=3065649 RepID=A0ABZ0GPX9_9GAMM|nr:hypothetical protein RI844_00470 [Colwelliaceae bacterium S1-1]
MGGYQILIILVTILIFFNALCHFKGWAKKGAWQGYSAKGQFYTAIAFSCLCISLYGDEYIGNGFLSLAFMFLYLFILFRSMKIEKIAQTKQLTKLATEGSDALNHDIIFSFQIGLIIAIAEAYDYYINDKLFNWFIPLGMFSFVLIVRIAQRATASKRLQ